MFYRAHISLAFAGEAAARKALEKAIAQLPKAIVINPGQDNEEKGHILIEQCFHDENPATPCVVLEFWEPASP